MFDYNLNQFSGSVIPNKRYAVEISPCGDIYNSKLLVSPKPINTYSAIYSYGYP